MKTTIICALITLGLSLYMAELWIPHGIFHPQFTFKVLGNIIIFLTVIGVLLNIIKEKKIKGE